MSICSNISLRALTTGEIVIDTSRLKPGQIVEIPVKLWKDFKNFAEDNSFFPFGFERCRVKDNVVFCKVFLVEDLE